MHDFRYIRSKSNPADTLTRGTKPSQLTGWLEGSAFLQLPGIKWPSFQVEDQSIQSEVEVLKEMKPTEKANMSIEHKAAIAAVNTKPEQIKTEDNPILQQLLPEPCSPIDEQSCSPIDEPHQAENGPEFLPGQVHTQTPEIEVNDSIPPTESVPVNEEPAFQPRRSERARCAPA